MPAPNRLIQPDRRRQLPVRLQVEPRHAHRLGRRVHYQPAPDTGAIQRLGYRRLSSPLRTPERPLVSPSTRSSQLARRLRRRPYKPRRSVRRRANRFFGIPQGVLVLRLHREILIDPGLIQAVESVLITGHEISNRDIHILHWSSQKPSFLPASPRLGKPPLVNKSAYRLE